MRPAYATANIRPRLLAGLFHARTAGDRSTTVDMRHMVDTHWTEQRSEDQLDYLED